MEYRPLKIFLLLESLSELARQPSEERLKGKTLQVVKVGVLGGVFGATGVRGLWWLVVVAKVVVEKSQEKL